MRKDSTEEYKMNKQILALLVTLGFVDDEYLITVFIFVLLALILFFLGFILKRIAESDKEQDRIMSENKRYKFDNNYLRRKL